jgi:predicted PurR-regulated permease PerM
VIGIFILLLLAALAYARALVMPIVLAFLLTLVFTPLRRFLERRRVPPSVTAALVVLSLLGLVLVGLALLSDPVSRWIENAPTLGRQLEARLRDLLGSVEAVVEAGEKIDEVASGGAEAGQEVVVRRPGLLATAAGLAPSVAAQGLFVLVLLFFSLASGDMFYEKIVAVAPTFRDKRRAVAIARDVERKLSRYLATITLINAALGASVALAVWAWGLPNPLLIGVVAAALNFIPYLGALAGVTLTLAVGLVSVPQPETAVLAAASYFLLTSLEGNLVTPYFVGRRLKLNTVVVFISVALWAWLWSVVGMLVATPMLVTIRTFCEHVPELRGLGAFLSARGEEAEERRDDQT